MARVQKMTYTEISDLLDAFVKTAHAKYDSYAYPTGYLQSVLVNMLADLPAAKQRQAVDQFRAQGTGS